jgi:hypothetical protein
MMANRLPKFDLSRRRTFLDPETSKATRRDMFADGFATVGPDLGKMSGTMMLALRLRAVGPAG